MPRVPRRITRLGLLVGLLFRAFAHADPPGGSSGTTSYRAITDLEQFDYRSQVGVAPGVPEGSIFVGFENNENVQLYNGNLLLTHPSSVSYPLNGGGSIGLSRVYNSMNVVDRQISLSVVFPDAKRSIVSNGSWVGLGWQMHLGRIAMESIERRGTWSCAPGCTDQPHDPCYQQSEYFFESPDGSKVRFASTDPNGGCDLTGKNDTFAGNEVTRELESGQDHPVLRVRYFREPGGHCHLSSGKPIWCDGRSGALPAECTHYGNNCQTSPDGTAHYLVELEDGTELRLERMQDLVRGSRDVIRNWTHNGWYTTRLRYPGKTGSGDTIVNVSYHKKACEDAGTSGCSALYPWGEAIQEITSPTHPEVHIWTELWSSADVNQPGYSANTTGMLKAIHAIGPGGQQVTYRYFYDDDIDEIDEGVTTVTKLVKVEIPSPGQTTPYSIQYFYRQGFDAIPHDAPGTSFLLDRIVYPLGGESHYTYGAWGCGTKKLCVGSNCGDLEEWGVGNRTCRGVIQRDLKPEGATGPVATSYWQRRWRASRCGENPAANVGLENRFAYVSADRTHRTSQLWNDPCDEAIIGPINKRLAGRFRYERSYDGAEETTLLRTVEYGYDMEQGISAPYASTDRGGSIPPTFARDITTTYHDDLGSCFGVGASGAPKTMETHFRLRDDWNNWRLAWEQGDYIKGTAAGPVHQIFYVDYYSPLTLPSKLLDRHELGAYSRAFSEEGSGTANQSGNSTARYEVTTKFEGVDTADAGLGEVKEIVAKDNWVAASTRLDTDPPTVTANQTQDATDLVSSIQFDNSANITQVSFSGGDADPATGTRKSYQVNYTWLQGRPATLRIQGLSYDSAKITPDRGAIAAAEDPSGLTTGFAFDTLGRLTTIDPPGTVEQPTRVIYPTLREMRVIRSAGSETSFLSGTDNTQTYASQEYDGIGRTITRKKAVPGNADGTGQLAVQIVRYDPVGREIFVSEWMTEEEYSSAPKLVWYEPSWDRNGDGTVGAPQYFVDGIPVKDNRPWGTTTFYGVPSTVTGDEANPLRATPDGLGRVRRIVRADGSITDKRYCGPHEEETVRSVRTAVDGASQFTDVTTRYYKDGNNRLVAVDTMPLAGQSGAAIGADALYDYDPRGNLVEVNLLRSDAFTTDPFSVWKNGPRPQGQKRTFTYSATGRLIDSFQPEKGNEKNRLYDVWGNLIAWQDQLGLDRGYYFRNLYDVAGRLTKSERRAGTLNGESVTGTGDRNLVQDSFDAAMDGWEEGKLSGTLFQAESTLWGQTGYTLGCMPAPPGQSGGGLYFGATCGYSEAPAGAQLVRKTVSGVGRDDALSFKYYRATRESATLGSGNRDRLSVWVSLDANDTASKRILFSQSEAQAVYPRWIKAPSVRPADWFTESEWPVGTTKTLTLFLVFEKGDTATSGLGSGVMIDDVYLGRKDSETLAEQVWDEAHCALGTGGDACLLFPVETQDRSNAQLTTVKSYQDGALLNTKRFVFKGLNGRASGMRSQIDWSGVARADVPTDWSDFAYGINYTARGLLETLSHPYLVGHTEKRDYLFSYSRDLVTAARDVQRDLPFFAASGIRYDAAGMPTQLAFANDTTQTIVRDAMHRPLSISSSWVSDPSALFQSGTYQYDGAGNIAAIGGQSFAYDAAGRLTRAWMLPQASDRSATQLHKLDYSFDWFGNIRSQQMASEAGGPTPPLGLNFSLSYDSTANESSSSYYGQDNTNRIITSGFAYDANGNALRFRGQYQQPVAALWTPLNRMRAFLEGDPTLGSAYPNETYQYDSAGYRIVRIDATGKPMLSLRDEKGSVLSEYLVENGLNHPRLDKDFVSLNGQLLIERTVAPGEPAMTTHSTLKTGSAYNFQLTAQTGHASYAVDISAPSGWRRQVSGVHPDSQNVFAINESEFSPDETNFVRVKIESPEPSGYSAPVSLSYDPDVTDSSANQIRTVSISRNGTHIVLRWSLNQANGKQTKLYFQRTDTGTTYLLTPQALNASVTSFTLDSQALASPCGQFWGTQFQTGVETGPGPSSDLGSSRPGEQGTQDGCGSPPPPSPAPATKFVNAYRHLDHLGSLRIARGDSGAVEAGVSSALDLYPYGTPFAASAAESSRQFTGHERDEATGQDYMLARYQGTGLARFLSTDPGDDTDTEVPLSWNKYTYVRDNPLKFLDPDGKATELHSKVSTYPVAGKTATEAWANAKAANSDGFPGHTTWSMAITSLESVEAGGGSHGAAVSIPIDVTVTVTATVSVPTWSAPAEASPGEQSAFDAASASLMKHEEGHVKIAKQGGEALEKAVMNVVGVGKGATQHQAAANAKSDLTRKVVAAQRDQREATKKKQKNYDKKTDHGKKP